jgi:hypothetical protein
VVEMISSDYRWDTTIGDVKTFNKRRINYNAVSGLVTEVKILMKRERDPEIKQELAKAGIALNKILMK